MDTPRFVMASVEGSPDDKYKPVWDKKQNNIFNSYCIHIYHTCSHKFVKRIDYAI